MTHMCGYVRTRLHARTWHVIHTHDWWMNDVQEDICWRCIHMQFNVPHKLTTHCKLVYAYIKTYTWTQAYRSTDTRPYQHTYSSYIQSLTLEAIIHDFPSLIREYIVHSSSHDIAKCTAYMWDVCHDSIWCVPWGKVKLLEEKESDEKNEREQPGAHWCTTKNPYKFVRVWVNYF